MKWRSKGITDLHGHLKDQWILTKNKPNFMNNNIWVTPCNWIIWSVCGYKTTTIHNPKHKNDHNSIINRVIEKRN